MSRVTASIAAAVTAVVASGGAGCGESVRAEKDVIVHGAAIPGESVDRSASEVIVLLEARGEEFDRFDADLTLRLARADGAKVTLAAQLWMARPDRVRVRSTKFGFLVCDVIVDGGAVNALLSKVVEEQARSSAQASVALGRVLSSLLGWRDRSRGALEVVAEDETTVVVRMPESGTVMVEWTLGRADARTIRVRRLEGDVVLGLLECRDHRDLGGMPLPRRLHFESATGTIDVTVENPRFGAEGGPDPFTVPKGAVPIE